MNPNTLLVDAGDLLPTQSDLQGELKGEVLARAYALMDYDAITLGETDLLFGMAYLRDLISRFDLPVVSMNVGQRAGSAATDADETGESTIDAGDRYEENPNESGTKRGRASDSDPSRSSGGETSRTEERAPGEEVERVAREIDEAAREADERPGEFPDYVLKNMDGVKVAIVGLLNHRVALPASVIDSVRIGHMEKYLERFLPQVRKEADLVVALAHCGSVERARVIAGAFDDLDVVVAAHVGPSAPHFEELNEAIVVYTRDRGRYVGRLDLDLDANKKIVGFDQETVPVAPSLPRDPEVLGLLSEYIDRLKVLVTSAAFRPTVNDVREPETNYLSSYACVDCHTEQYEGWSETPHAHAFETLENKDRDFDPDCQKCHTTGFRYRSGFVTPRGTPQHKGVGCEACHGPGGDHLDDPTATYGKITEAVCVFCHTRHNSPEFVYEKYLDEVRHD